MEHKLLYIIYDALDICEKWWKDSIDIKPVDKELTITISNIYGEQETYAIELRRMKWG